MDGGPLWPEAKKRAQQDQQSGKPRRGEKRMYLRPSSKGRTLNTSP